MMRRASSANYQNAGRICSTGFCIVYNYNLHYHFATCLADGRKFLFICLLMLPPGRWRSEAASTLGGPRHESRSRFKGA